MKRLLFVGLLAGVAVSHQLTETEYQDAFTKWMVGHDKHYAAEEFFYRFGVFRANLDFVRQHNDRFAQGLESYITETNKFADLTSQEFRDKFTGYKPDLRKTGQTAPALLKEMADPLSGQAFDWDHDKHVVTGVKDQGQCGSCWAFSTTGAMESAIAIKTGSLVSLSEQQLVDCAGAYGNYGCNGGLMDWAFSYCEANGLCTEAAYPYHAVNQVCQSSSCSASPSTKLSGYKDVTGGEVGASNSLVTDISTGPICIAIEADQSGFQLYKSGVFQGLCGTNLDHGVLLVGYGTDTGLDYWRVKNSWGTSWGEQGYIRMVRDKDECGLGIEPSYPVV